MTDFKRSISVPPHVCKVFPFKVSYEGVDLNILVVANCSKTWTGYFIQAKCQDTFEHAKEESQYNEVFQQWPVYDHIGINYKNIYCAICNGRKPFELTPFIVEYQSSIPHAHHGMYGNGASDTKMTIGKTTRRCNPARIDSCPYTYTNYSLTEGCRMYSANFNCRQEILHQSATSRLSEYKNPHCYMCNFATSNINDDPETYFYRCMAPSTTKPQNSVRVIWTFVSLNDIKIKTVDNGNVDCARNEYYDPLSADCLAIQCPEGFLLKGHRCLPQQTTPWTLDSLTCSRADSMVAFPALGNLNEAHTNEETCLLWRVFADDERLQEKHINKSSIKQIVSELDIDIFKVSYHANSVSGPLRKLVMLNVTSFQAKQLQYELSKRNATRLAECGVRELEVVGFCEMNLEGYNCSSGKWYTGNLEDVTVMNINDEYEIYGLNNNTYIKPHFLVYYAFYNYIDRLERFKKTIQIEVCGEETLSCPMVTLNSTEFTMRKNATDETTVDVNGHILLPDEFMLISNQRQLQMCQSTHERIVSLVSADSNASFTVPLMVANAKYDLFNVVTYTLTSISLTLYWATFVTHCAFPQLRNSHGRAIMHFVSATFCAHLLSLFNEGYHIYRKLCVTIAFLSHYSWLVSFNWMSIMAINLATTFAWNKLQKMEDTLTNLYIQPLLGWGLPLLLTLPCLALHFTSYPFEYGTEEACWVSDPMANVIVFGLPVALSLVLNGICFVITTRALYAAKQQSKKLKCKARDGWVDFLVSVKVSQHFVNVVTSIFNLIEGFFEPDIGPDHVKFIRSNCEVVTLSSAGV